MSKSTSIGLIGGVGLIYGAIFLGNGWLKFFEPASLLLVVGGTGAALVVNYSFAELRRVPQGVREIFNFEPPRLRRHIDQLSNLARTARREGVLALDRRLDDLDNDLLRFGLEMAVDGMGEEEIAGMLDQRIAEKAQDREFIPDFFISAGTYAPAFGMIGTLIGLIQMLQNLDDPTQIGSGMATAMVTTFYGAILANLIFLPLGKKAKSQNRSRAKVEYVVREGTLAISRGASPRMIEQRLGFLAEDEEPHEGEVEATESVTADTVSEAQAAAATT